VIKYFVITVTFAIHYYIEILCVSYIILCVCHTFVRILIESNNFISKHSKEQDDVEDLSVDEI
jgi:hypothetical protein